MYTAPYRQQPVDKASLLLRFLVIFANRRPTLLAGIFFVGDYFLSRSVHRNLFV